MQIESYALQAQVIQDDGTRASVVLHVHPNDVVFAGASGIPEPSHITPDVSHAEALVTAVLEDHVAVPVEEHVPERPTDWGPGGPPPEEGETPVEPSESST